MKETKQNRAKGLDCEFSKLLHKGKWANADIYRTEKDERQSIWKGFSFRSFWVRWTIGLILTHREVKILKKLRHISGVPNKIKQRCIYCFEYAYLEGTTIGTISNQQKKLPKSYFLEAEKLLEKMHAQHIVHLDLRRGENWLVQPNNKPAIIDFQSAAQIKILPKALQQKLYDIDYSGLYKFWIRLCEEPLTPERQELLDRVNKMRKFWLMRGYAFKKMRKKKRK